MLLGLISSSYTKSAIPNIVFMLYNNSYIAIECPHTWTSCKHWQLYKWWRVLCNDQDILWLLFLEYAKWYLGFVVNRQLRQWFYLYFNQVSLMTSMQMNVSYIKYYIDFIQIFCFSVMKYNIFDFWFFWPIIEILRFESMNKLFF